MRTYRIVSFFLALLVLVPLLVVPAFMGFSISDGTVHLEGFEQPDDPAEFLTFKLLDMYYLFFVLLNVFPFMLLVFWSFGARFSHWWEKRKDDSDAVLKRGPDMKGTSLFREEKFPLVSVILPCYNESRYIGKAVTNAYRQSYTGPIEILVVDDGSRDSTWSIGRIFKTSMEKRTVKVFHKENGGKASAITYGISKAAGKIIITSDGDSEMHEDAVRELVETFRRYPDAGIVGGFVSIKNSHKGYLTRLQQLEYHITQHMIRMNQSEDGSVLIAPGPIFGMRADLARHFPPVNRTVVEDCDLTMSILPTGFTTRSTYRSVSRTNAPENWTKWFRQRRRWIYGQFQAWRENKWHLKKNPWGLYTYFTWVSTSVSAMMFILGLLLTTGLVLTGRDYYNFIEFISLRAILVFVLYLVLRSAILLSYRDTAKLLHYLPLKIVYDMINGLLTGYLYTMYITHRGVRVKWGHKEEVVE
ncbi:MAG: glycosyltransferase family 2 protein [Thermoplasmatota archaeon]